jgi:hypothetical protein
MVFAKFQTKISKSFQCIFLLLPTLLIPKLLRDGGNMTELAYTLEDRCPLSSFQYVQWF